MVTTELGGYDKSEPLTCFEWVVLAKLKWGMCPLTNTVAADIVELIVHGYQSVKENTNQPTRSVSSSGQFSLRKFHFPTYLEAPRSLCLCACAFTQMPTGLLILVRPVSSMKSASLGIQNHVFLFWMSNIANCSLQAWMNVMWLLTLLSSSNPF